MKDYSKLNKDYTLEEFAGIRGALETKVSANMIISEYHYKASDEFERTIKLFINIPSEKSEGFKVYHFFGRGPLDNHIMLYDSIEEMPLEYRAISKELQERVYTGISQLD